VSDACDTSTTGYYKGITFLFVDEWDEVLGDDSNIYDVYVAPGIDETYLKNPEGWRRVTEVKRFVTRMPVKDVRFDSTRRRTIESSLLDRIIVDFNLHPG